MRISTKIAIALCSALLVFTIFLGLSRYMMQQIQKQESYVSRLNVISREVSNVEIGNLSFHDHLSGAAHVDDALSATKHGLEETLSYSDEIETIYILGMLEHVDAFSEVFQRSVKSKEYVAELNYGMEDEIVRFTVLNMEIQSALDSAHETLHEAQDFEGSEWEAMERFSSAHAYIWGWLNRAVSVIDRELLLNRHLDHFDQSFEIAREAYESRLEELNRLAPEIKLVNVEDYLKTLRAVMADLRKVSTEFKVAVENEADSRMLLDEHGLRLREMLDRLIERVSERKADQAGNLDLIFWLFAVVLLVGSAVLTLWFSLSISRPMSRFATSVREVANGNFDLETEADGDSELDDLARAFNDMTEKLRRSYGEVEEKVRQRTKELQVASLKAESLADEAQEANMTKSAFLATMSHEIRTPLNSIIGFSEMLEDGSLSEEQKSDLATIRRSGAILLDLINDILDLSKVEAGKLRLEVAPVNLEETVHEVTSMFKLSLARKGVGLRVEIFEDVADPVFTDPTRLNQVLNNLISNAVKFTTEGEIYVRVWREIEDVGGGVRYYISVSDTGIGIPQDSLDQVFVAFTQADSSTTRKYGGTGLGLTIGSRLVEMLGGEINVVSKEGMGSTFTFYIRNLVNHQSRLKLTRAPTVYELDFEVSPKIMVVEDDVANYTLAKKILERFGLSVDWAKNGVEAVEYVKHADYDFIFMDLQMPELDGISATYAIHEICRERPKSPYIAALTANTMAETRKDCEEAGMRDFITKPISGETIKASLIRFQQYSQSKGPPVSS